MICPDPTGAAAVLPRNASLAERLAELTAITATMEGRPQAEVRAHVDVVRAFLYEEVLLQAHVEELELIPHLDRLGRSAESSVLLAEHDTLRDAVAGIDGLVRGPLTPDLLDRVTGLLRDIELLLHTHLDHEHDAALMVLDLDATADPSGRT